MQERHTVQKDMVYTALCRLHNHPTAEQICAEVQRQCPTISRATVYRVLGAMAEKGTILRIGVAGGADHYDHQTHAHYHICCDECGKMDDVTVSRPVEVLPLVEDACGYELTGCTLLLHGICESCRKQEQGA